MDSYTVFAQIVNRLEKVGFKYEGDLGINGREVFTRIISDDFMDYHFYVYTKDCEENARHSKFRNALFRNPKIAQDYGVLKTRLIEEVDSDRELYTNSKTDFILWVLNNTDDDGVWIGGDNESSAPIY